MSIAGPRPLCILAACVLGSPSAAEEPAEDAAGRIADLERRLRRLEKEIAAGKSAKAAGGAEDDEPPGLLTLGDATLFLEGKAEVQLIDSANENDPILGMTEEPSPHVMVERFRLEPRLDVGRGLLLRAQIDFKPEDAQTILKEMVLEHDAELFPWLASDLRIGLQDRFFRPSRPLKNYPLVGNALWRDETAGIIWRLSLGDEEVGRAGAPEEPKAKEPPASAASTLLDSLGRLDLHLSIGNGPQLDSNEVGFDGASFNDIVQDDRNLTGDLAFREVGVGLGYRRASGWGELELRGFYVDDQLSDESLDFLQQELTVRDSVTGAPLDGYGDSGSRRSHRYGATIEYWLPATVIWGPSARVKRRDGLRVQGQWMQAADGELERTGWGAHGGYRWSFPRPLLFDRYFRKVEPIISYADLRTNLATSPLLPGTWDRRQLLLGLLVEITGNVILDIEYSFHLEKTGGPSVGAPDSVDNNELLVELVVTF